MLAVLITPDTAIVTPTTPTILTTFIPHAGQHDSFAKIFFCSYWSQRMGRNMSCLSSNRRVDHERDRIVIANHQKEVRMAKTLGYCSFFTHCTHLPLQNLIASWLVFSTQSEHSLAIDANVIINLSQLCANTTSTKVWSIGQCVVHSLKRGAAINCFL